MTTEVFYASTNDDTLASYSDTNYNLARTGQHNMYGYSGPQPTLLRTGQAFGSPNYWCYEEFLAFDTSSIPDAAVISAATLAQYVTDDYSDTDFTAEVRLYDWGTTVENADFIVGSSLGNYTLLATASSVGIGVGAYKEFTDVAFPANVNKTGQTRIFVTSDRMRNNNTPTQYEFLNFSSADVSGTSQDPKLTVVYTADPVVPGAPTIGTATAGNTQATITWSAPANNGGATITNYRVTSSPGDFYYDAGANLSGTVTGLTNGTAYTFTVVATNSAGNSAASAASNGVTPATVPGAPTIGTATAGNAQATVSWSAPASTGGSVITNYRVTSSPGGLYFDAGTSLNGIVAELTNGTPYTFTVTATNAIGTSSASAASNSVTPQAAPPGLIKHATLSVLADDPGAEVSANEWNAGHAIENGSITPDKILFTGTNKILGRASGGGGNGEEITATAVARTLLAATTTAAQRAAIGSPPTASPTFTGIVSAPAYAASGLPGATTPSRYVGATALDAPASGDFVTGDFVFTLTGKIYVCTAGGNPGTWVLASGTSGGGGGGSVALSPTSSQQIATPGAATGATDTVTPLAIFGNGRQQLNLFTTAWLPVGATSDSGQGGNGPNWPTAVQGGLVIEPDGAVYLLKNLGINWAYTLNGPSGGPSQASQTFAWYKYVVSEPSGTWMVDSAGFPCMYWWPVGTHTSAQMKKMYYETEVVDVGGPDGRKFRPVRFSLYDAGNIETNGTQTTNMPVRLRFDVHNNLDLMFKVQGGDRFLINSSGGATQSDERIKDWRGGLSEAELRASKKIVKEIGVYQLKADVESQSEDAMLRVGVTAQKVIAALESEGLDYTDYSLVSESGDVYAVNYSDLSMFIIAGQEQRLAALEAALGDN